MNGEHPPQARSIAGAALAATPADGALWLQRCGDCGTVQYPPRERCGSCLADALQPAALAPGAEVLAVTTLHHSLEPWFAARVPWTVASLRLDAGPVAFAHIERALAQPGTRVRVATARDAGGAWCLVAIADDGSTASAALQRTLNTLGMNP
jgi:uncharacterized OB-fold protein